jgi:hypothetical protein
VIGRGVGSEVRWRTKSGAQLGPEKVVGLALDC